MMIKRIILLSLILSGCTPPDPPAYACSPPLDGRPFRCPHPGDFVLPDPKPKPMPQPTPPSGEIDIWSNAGLWQLHHMYQRYERRKQMEANMTIPSDAINKACLLYTSPSPRDS